MSDEEAIRAFEGAGWTVGEGSSSAETPVVGESGRYSVRPDEKLLGDETVFELRDGELGMKAYARRVPTPERAAELLERYGVPEEISDVTPGKVPMVPPGAELG